VGSRTEVEYRLAWARTHCKLLGLVTNSERGVWTLTELGRIVDAHKVEKLKFVRRKILATERKTKKNTQWQAGTPQYLDDVTDDDAPDDAPAWQQELLSILKKMEPASFERLTKRLLREAGFTNVRMAGKIGDDGIDGVGVYRISLVSFPVFFSASATRGRSGLPRCENFAVRWLVAVTEDC
jgi:restriction system protein